MKKIVLISSIIITIFIFFMINMLDIPAKSYPFDFYGNIALPEMYGESKYGQTFLAERNNLYKIDLLFANYDRVNDKNIIFHLKQKNSESDIRNVVINARDIKDNKFHSIKFENISDSKEHEYYFYLESPKSFSGNAITLWYYPDGGKYDDGTILIKNPNYLDCQIEQINEKLQLKITNGGNFEECYLIHHFQQIQDWTDVEKIEIDYKSQINGINELIIFTKEGFFVFKIESDKNSEKINIILNQPNDVSGTPNLSQVTAIRIDPNEGINSGIYNIGNVIVFKENNFSTFNFEDFWFLISTKNNFEGNLAFREHYQANLEEFSEIFLDRITVFKPDFYNKDVFSFLFIIFLITSLFVGILITKSDFLDN